MAKAIADYHMCIVKSMRLDSSIISRALNMRLVMQYGVGLEGNVFGVSWFSLVMILGYFFKLSFSFIK